ncbi:MAG: hypothetical protein V1797_09510 [Pseudomonadota bacterium]
MSIKVSREFLARTRSQDGQAEAVLILDDAWGRRVFAGGPPDPALVALLDAALADGAARADGSRSAGRGSYQVLGHGPLVESFGRLREGLTPVGGDLLAGLRQDAVGALSLRLLERGRTLAGLEAGDSLLGARAQILLGYPGLPATDWLCRFSGRVQSYQMDRQGLTLKLRAV